MADLSVLPHQARPKAVLFVFLSPSLLRQKYTRASGGGAMLYFSLCRKNCLEEAMSGAANRIDSHKLLQDLDHWEEFLKDRYPEPEPELVGAGGSAEGELQKEKTWK